jgi:protein-S-isoprenylcysteine O-methyltransferase Ste14
MIFTFISSNILYTHVDVSPWHPMSVLGAIGAGLVAYTMYVLYMLQARKRILLTHGVFKYTRHPMYTGFFLMNLSAYLATEPDVWFYIQQCAFFASLAIAGRMQEIETIMRFGKEAEQYYAVTPRLFFMYPFRRWIGVW